MNEIEIAVLNVDVISVEADVLALKYASRFYGADEAVADILEDYELCTKSEIAESANQDGHFLVETKHLIHAKNVLFVLTPPHVGFRYRQVREFSEQALVLSQQHLQDCSHIAMTLHGPGFGLDISVAFLAELAGIVSALGGGRYPPGLKGISIVERDAERSSLMKLLLRERFAGVNYSHVSATGAAQILNTEALKSMHNPTS